MRERGDYRRRLDARPDDRDHDAGESRRPRQLLPMAQVPDEAVEQHQARVCVSPPDEPGVPELCGGRLERRHRQVRER